MIAVAIIGLWGCWSSPRSPTAGAGGACAVGGCASRALGVPPVLAHKYGEPLPHRPLTAEPPSATTLAASSGGSWSISLYVLAIAVVSFVCISLLSETYLTDLAEIRAEERRLVAEARESAAS